MRLCQPDFTPLFDMSCPNVKRSSSQRRPASHSCVRCPCWPLSPASHSCLRCPCWPLSPASHSCLRCPCWPLSPASHSCLICHCRPLVPASLSCLRCPCWPLSPASHSCLRRPCRPLQVQRDMDKLGLRILNANIAEMQDLDDANRYFYSLKQKVSCRLPAQQEGHRRAAMQSNHKHFTQQIASRSWAGL